MKTQMTFTPPTHRLWHRATTRSKWRVVHEGTRETCAAKVTELAHAGQGGDFVALRIEQHPNDVFKRKPKES